MSILGDGKGIVDLLGRGWTWVQDRRDPVRAQAQRLIDAFEAHGIARQQIARVLPPGLDLPSSALSNADKLRDKVTPALLDWAATYLALNRSWFDGVDPQIHQLVEGYKNPRVHLERLQSRPGAEPQPSRFLYVVKSDATPVTANSDDRVSLVYAEKSEGLDGRDLSRYWLFSEGWHLDHHACVTNMVAVVAVARSLGIHVIGLAASHAATRKLDTGRIFVPTALARPTGRWHPEDLIDPPPGARSEWQAKIWLDVQADLKVHGIQLVGTDREPARIT